MKNPLSVSIFLFLLTSFFSTDAFAQVIPDPGKNPLDSTLQNHSTGHAVSKAKTTAHFATGVVVLPTNPGITTDSLFNKPPSQEVMMPMPTTKKLKCPHRQPALLIIKT